MKKTILALCAIFISSTAHPQSTDVSQELRVFKGSNGKEIKAVLIDKNDTSATLLLENKRRAVVPLTSLSADDQEYIKSWNKEKALFLQKCLGLSVRQLLELRGYESFPMTLEGNSIIITAKLNGKDARFVVDTGAGTSLLHTKMVENCGLKLGPMTEEVHGVAGSVPACWVDVNTLSMGESLFKDRKILATDMDKDKPEGSKDQSTAGLFGADLLKQLDTVISYKENRIFFRPDKSDRVLVDGDAAKSEDAGVEGEVKDQDEVLNFRIFKMRDGKSFRANVVTKTSTVLTVKLANGKTQQVPIYNLSDDDQKYADAWTEAGDIFLRHCGALKIEEVLTLRKYNSFQYERRGNHIFVDGTLNDKAVTWMIDTGADSSLLDLKQATNNGCEVGPMEHKVYGIGGSAPAGETVMKKITLGKVELTNRRTLATDMTGRAGRDLDYVGLFGADFMRELDAVITYREDRIFLYQR
jgi:predicted aspartyl protease